MLKLQLKNGINISMKKNKRGKDLIETIDGQFENLWIEVKNELSAARSLRNSLLDLAYKLTDNEKEAALLLVNPKMTKLRIKGELIRIKETFRPNIIERLNIIIYENGKYNSLVKPISHDIELTLKRLLPQWKKKNGIRLNSIDFYFELLKILIHQWINNKGPMTSDLLAKEAAGCSYPTIANILKRLGNHIKRYSDRKIELRHFPSDEWKKLLVMSDKVRSTINFTDISGQPRLPDSLLRRLRKLKRKDIAVGGVYGAVYHYPKLNIAGNPRLDLSIHCQDKEFDLDFIESLDPALEITETSGDPVHIAIHFIRRKMTFFTAESNEIIWADPVECLLDLHEARLEPQAKEFFDYLLLRKKSK